MKAWHMSRYKHRLLSRRHNKVLLTIKNKGVQFHEPLCFNKYNYMQKKYFVKIILPLLNYNANLVIP